jgi:nucleoid-associated protein YgaU
MDMKNTTPILVLTGLAIVAAVGIAGLTREQWLGQPTPAVATSEPAPAPAPAAPAETAASEPAVEQPSAQPDTTAETQSEQQPAAASETQQQTAAAQPEQTPAAQGEEQSAALQPEAGAQPEAAAPSEAAAQPKAQPAPNAGETKVVPAFDTVRVEKTGEAVIAGRAEAGSNVVVKLNGEEIGKTVANDDGAFVVVPEKPLPAGSGAITIEATGKGDMQPVASTQSVAVIVPEGQQQALVAIVSPDAPTRVLQKPEAPAETAAAEQPAAAAPAAEEPAAEQKPAKLVSIDAVDYDSAGNIVFSGQGEAGNTARIYVDNGFLGDAPVGEDGRWTYSGTANVAQGVHTLRVDGLDSQGNVVNRVEVPFFREDQSKVASATEPAAPAAEQPAASGEPAEAPTQQPEPAASEATATAETTIVQSQPAAEQPAAQQPAAEQPAVEQPASQAATSGEAAESEATQKPATTAQAEETVAATAAPETGTTPAPREGRIVIQPGNNLWRISRVLYGTGNKFTMLYEANKDQIRNPNLIYPGQVFRTPDVAPTTELIDPRRRDPLGPSENAAASE